MTKLLTPPATLSQAPSPQGSPLPLQGRADCLCDSCELHTPELHAVTGEAGPVGVGAVFTVSVSGGETGPISGKRL